MFKLQAFGEELKLGMGRLIRAIEETVHGLFARAFCDRTALALIIHVWGGIRQRVGRGGGVRLHAGSSGSCQHIKYHRTSTHCSLSDVNVETFYAVIQPQWCSQGYVL
jgi:hypothetical protein